MAIKKTELYSSLWASCDELRGGMDASQYKDYVLTFLFLKYVSDKFLKDEHGAMIVCPEGCTFPDVVKLKGDKEVGEKLNIVLDGIAKANGLDWLTNKDNDFNDEDRLGKGKEMVDRLSKLIGIFEGLDFASNSAQGDDLLGDAYEYLMRNFASESGKSKGQFYTPAEVSRILSKVVGITSDTTQDKTVYDPTCGSGSLLLKAADEAKNGLSIYGQEKDVATTALCRMNMILHNNADAEIAPGGHSTLADPFFKQTSTSLKTFDFAVANPPFSFKAWNTGFTPEDDVYARFEYGVPPEKNGDYAFLLHIIKSLKSTGKAAVILPHGVLFRGNAEADIRRNLIKQGYIKGIIGLPANLFYGTGIPACIIVIDKEQASARKSIFMIDASKGFMKDGAKNRLREQDIHKIVDVFNKQITAQAYARSVSFSEIEKNEYNLNIPRYIDSSDAEDIHDLHAHFHGGIPNADIDALQHYWDVFPTLRHSLFTDNPTQGYSDALVARHEVKASILANQEYQAFKQQSTALFHAWKQAHHANLQDMPIGANPKEIIQQLSEDLLARFTHAKLLSKYTIYQILMDYWHEPMQDDIYMITQDDWAAGNAVREIVPMKDKNNKTVYKEEHDFEFGTARNKKRYKSDLIPPQFIINRFFADEQDALNALQQQQDQATQTLETYIEEHSGEDGWLEEAKNDKGNINQKSIKDRLKKATDPDEIQALNHCLTLLAQEAKAKKAVKEASAALNKQVFEKIPQLSIDDIKTLVIEDKWYASLEVEIQAEIERVTQALAKRIQTLEERYQTPLPELANKVGELSAKVDHHLKMMGVLS